MASNHFKGRSKLTATEMKILKWIAEGKTAADVGCILARAEGTIKCHRVKILFKLDACNVAHAVSKAYQLGILKIGDEEQR